MSARRNAVLTTTAATALTALTLVGAATSASAGSDSPTPYRVTGTGLELPPGAVFQVHGHVNVVYTSAAGRASRNVHIEGPGTPFGDIAGASTLTWDRIGLPPDACITWVQVAGYDEHFGEGGQADVCRTPLPQPPAPSPAPTTPPAPTPGTSSAPTTAPPPAPTVDVSAAPTPVAPAAPTPTPVAAAAPAPAPTPTPTPTERSEVLPAAADTPPPAAPAPSGAPERADVLAATGTRTGALLGGAAAALTLGAGLLLGRRRTPTRA